MSAVTEKKQGIGSRIWGWGAAAAGLVAGGAWWILSSATSKVTNAAGSVMVNSAAKVAEAVGFTDAAKTVSQMGPGLLANGATAMSAQKVSANFAASYRADCKSFLQDAMCIKDGSLSILAGLATIVALGAMLYIANTRRK